MNEERERLAELLEEEQESGRWASSPDADLYGFMADAILAAGYRKPRTITTAEELDALPRGAVVLSDVYISNHGQAISFQRWEDGAWHRGARSSDTHPDNFLPATVLYEPTA